MIGNPGAVSFSMTIELDRVVKRWRGKRFVFRANPFAFLMRDARRTVRIEYVTPRGEPRSVRFTGTLGELNDGGGFACHIH